MSRRWTPRVAARRLVVVAREEGARSLWFKLLGEAGYRRLTLFELRCDAAPDVSPPPGVTLAQLAPDAVDEYLAFRSEGTADEVRARLRDGHRCFVARLDGAIAHVSWAARDRMWSWYLDRHVPLAADETCTFDTWTDPSARGRGIGPALRAHMARELAASGHRRVLATIYPENRPGVRMVEKLGYRRIGTIGYVSLGPWRRDFCRMRPGALAPGAAASDPA